MTPEKYVEFRDRIAKINATAIALSQRLQKASGGTYTPPQAVRSAAAHGLELRDKWKRGGLSNAQASEEGIGSGVQRAVNLKNGDALSLMTVKRMHAFFSRHQKNYAPDKKEPDGGPTAGTIAWYLWGGNAGKSWADGIVADAAKVEKAGDAYVMGDSKPPVQGKSFVQGDGNSYGVEKDGSGPGVGDVHVPAPIGAALNVKATAHNQKAKHDWQMVTPNLLQKVYARGCADYADGKESTMSKGVYSMGRVDSYLKLLRGVRPVEKDYTQDFDILPSEHPKSTQKG